MTLIDRKRGALVGLAVGDALGAAVEFRAPGSFEPVTGYRGGGPFGLGPGQWTDDTSMALALADSIAAVGWDLDDQLQRYVTWYSEGKYSVIDRCFDIGGTTAGALHQYMRHGDARTAADASEQSSGNGALMRLAPVPIRYANLLEEDLPLLVERLMESTLTTHGSELCLSASAYFGLVLAGLIQGQPRDAVLDPQWPPLVRLQALRPLRKEIAEIADGSFRRRKTPQIVGSGFVVKSLEAALWAFHKGADFREAVLLAVNLGNDTDTTGAICGQLAGACWGESGIPPEWRQGLARPEMLEKALQGILA